MPDWNEDIRRRLATLTLEPTREMEIVEELAQHLDDRYHELRAGGATQADASRAALAELSEGGWLARELRRVERQVAAEPVVPGAGRRHWIGDLWRDLRYGLRTLLRQPVFTGVAALALALGIGGNTAIFSLVNAILLRQLPFRNPEQLVWVSVRRPEPGQFPFTLPDFIDYRDQNRGLDGIAAFANWSANLTDRGDPERLQGLRISANAFLMLGVEAVVGRALLPADDTPGQERVVVLSDGLWKRRFGADPQMVGKPLTLNGASYTVVGVLPPQFFFPIKEAELAIPLAPDADPWRDVRTSVHFLRGLARLKPGVTREQAEADLTAVAQRLRRQYPVANARKVGVTLGPLYEEVVGGFRLALWVLLGAVGVVLLITCVNLANLALARAVARHREMAIRTALGATRWRLVQQLATESLLLAGLGGAAGLLLASYGIDLLLALSPANLPRAAEVGVDFRVLGFTLALSLLAGLIFGLAPAWQATRVSLNDELKESGRGGAGGARQSRARGLLVVSEIALSLVLLVGAGLLVKSFLRLQGVHPGFDAENVLVVRLSLPKGRYPDRAAAAAFHDRLRPRLESLPGVETVGVVSALPLSGTMASIPFTIEGRATAQDEAPRADYRMVSAGYFRALRIPLLAGRAFNERDTSQAPSVALISQKLAHRYWPDGNPVGAHLRIDDNDQGPRPVEIVGVVGDVQHLSLDVEPAPHIYLPLHQAHEDAVVWLTGNQYWLLRTAVDPLTLSAAARREIQAVDRDVPASSIRTMEQYLAASVAPRRFNLWLLTVFAGAALVLAGTGLFGVISCGVAQRTREIGIRVALGAQAGDVLRLVIGQGMSMTLGGIALGLLAAFGLTRLMKSLLFGVSATDPLTFLVTAGLLTFVALLACWIPARRALNVDPMVALREE
ncbi:MAG TPA: ABC transporter permease [Candidatus Polarisedimenticolia bacterium]|jgi:putative ABC transport system permease protein|nr:ABC transporter permease [Candidatus Polarisedimenticolia bacterium]